MNTAGDKAAVIARHCCYPEIAGCHVHHSSNTASHHVQIGERQPDIAVMTSWAVNGR
jgi:hypothetical protein